MVCENPRTIWMRTKFPAYIKNEETLHKYNKPSMHYKEGWQEITVPCGQCDCCKMEKANEWATRITNEAECWDFKGIFLTLSYNNANLPFNKEKLTTLRQKDIVNFKKRLRKFAEKHQPAIKEWINPQTGKKERPIRTFECGEYGFNGRSVLSVVVVVRQKHTYCQGLALQHQKKRKYDFFNPMFKGLGAQPRPKSIIYLSGTATDKDVWNFAPAWQEYKFELDRATGLMAPNVPNNLAVYNYTDLYENVPNSGEEWINETPVYLDRTLAVQSTATPQFISNFQFDIERINTVPNFVLPGIDKI